MTDDIFKDYKFDRLKGVKLRSDLQHKPQTYAPRKVNKQLIAVVKRLYLSDSKNRPAVWYYDRIYSHGNRRPDRMADIEGALDIVKNGKFLF